MRVAGKALLNRADFNKGGRKTAQILEDGPRQQGLGKGPAADAVGAECIGSCRDGEEECIGSCRARGRWWEMGSVRPVGTHRIREGKKGEGELIAETRLH